MLDEHGRWYHVQQDDPDCILKRLRVGDGWLYKVIHVSQWDCYNKPLEYTAHHFYTKDDE